MNITEIPTNELIKDLKDSIDDIRICEEALSLRPPVINCGDTSVKERLETNKKIVDMIKKELVARGFADEKS